MESAELIALAAANEVAAAPRLASRFRELFRTVRIAGEDEHPLQVRPLEKGGGFRLSMRSPKTAKELVVDLDLRAIADTLLKADILFERLAAALDETTGRYQLGLYRPGATSELRSIDDLEGMGDATHTAVQERLASQITGSDTVLVVGPSSSGKTTSVAAACRAIGSERRARCAYFDLALGLPQSSQLLQFSLQRHSEALRERVVVLDNVQAQVGAVALLHELVRWSRVLGPVSFVLVAWPSARTAISAMFSEIAVCGVSGDRVLAEINAHLPTPLPPEGLVAVQQVARGDVLVGFRLIEAFRRTGRVLDPVQLRDNLVAELGVKRLAPQDRECLRDITRINALDIPMKRAYLEGRHGSERVSSLVANGLIREEGDLLRVGHRSRARLIYEALAESPLPRGSATDALAAPDEVLRYFRSLRRDELYQTLIAIDAVFAESFSSSGPRLRFSGLLRSVAALVRQLEIAQRVDPTWGNNLASAVFAGMAFSWGSPVEWQRIAKWIRAKTAISDGKLEFPLGFCSARKDFDLIRQAMLEEECSLNAQVATHWELAASFDAESAYKNWVVGLLLCFEGSALEQDGQRQAALLEFIAARRLASGGIYPKRIPWIAARVMLGLGACGESVDSSDLARTMADWLLSLSSLGGTGGSGLWPSGTGHWNTPEQCTAMVVMALRSVGVPYERINARFDASLLRQKLATFEIERDEIDILLILECLSEFEGFGDSSEALLAAIAERYTDSDRVVVESLDPEAMREESSKIPFVVNALLNILWDRLSRSLETAFSSETPKQPQVPAPRLDESTIQEAKLLLRMLGEVEQEKKKALVRAHSHGVPRSAIVLLEAPVTRLRDAAAKLDDLLAACDDSVDDVGRTERLTLLDETCSGLRAEFEAELRAQ